VLIVGTIGVAAMRTVGAAAAASRVRANRAQGTALARMLMSEILQTSYKEPVDTPSFGRESGESGSSRQNWDDVDDYDNFSESNLTRKDGTPVNNATGWSWKVNVFYVDPANPSATVNSDQGLKQIVVKVNDPQGRQTKLEALRSSFGTYDLPSTTSKTYVSHVGISLQTGPDPRARVDTAVYLTNEPPQ
jgi:hypothetical protein